MRYLAKVLAHTEVKRLIAHDSGDGTCLLYLYDTEFDTACVADYWFESVDQALNYCNKVYGVERKDWFVIGATAEHCQDDWITPTRIPERATGNPEWGRLQQLINGQWVELDTQALPKIKIDYSQLKRMDSGL